MTYSPFTATGDGTTTAYTIAFQYIDTADVKARINDVATTAFTISGSTVTFTAAPPSGQTIKIFRDTDNQTIQADFQSGSALRATDLNSNFTQLLFVTQESTDVADTATTDAANSVTSANSAVATSATANTNATNAVAASNTALATSTAAESAAAGAVTTATTALNNSRESDGAGGFTTAIAKATTALSTATSASSSAATSATNSAAAVVTANASSVSATAAVNTANTASTNISAAVTTANTAATNASTALSTANSAASDASTAISSASTANTTANTANTTANTASTNASAAVTTANGAATTANTASTNATTALNAANAASAAVSAAAFYTPIAAIANLPGSPSNEYRVEVINSTGVQSSSSVSGVPSGFVGSTDLTVRLQYNSSTSKWAWQQYFAADPENRYLTELLPTVKGDSTNGSGQITLNCENNSHGVKIKGPPHSASATYTLTLPNNTGTNGQFLSTNGSGVMSWATMTQILVADGGNFDSGSSLVTSSSTFDGGSF